MAPRFIRVVALQGSQCCSLTCASLMGAATPPGPCVSVAQKSQDFWALGALGFSICEIVSLQTVIVLLLYFLCTLFECFVYFWTFVSKNSAEQRREPPFMSSERQALWAHQPLAFSPAPEGCECDPRRWRPCPSPHRWQRSTHLCLGREDLRHYVGLTWGFGPTGERGTSPEPWRGPRSSAWVLFCTR